MQKRNWHLYTSAYELTCPQHHITQMLYLADRKTRCVTRSAAARLATCQSLNKITLINAVGLWRSMTADLYIPATMKGTLSLTKSSSSHQMNETKSSLKSNSSLKSKTSSTSCSCSTMSSGCSRSSPSFIMASIAQLESTWTEVLLSQNGYGTYKN